MTRRGAPWRTAGWILLAFIACSFSGVRSHAEAPGLPSSLDPRLRAALRSGFAAERLRLPRTGGEPMGATSGPTASHDASPWIGCFVEGPVSVDQIGSVGAIAGTHVADRWTVRVPLDRLTQLAAIPGVRRIRAAARTEPQLNLSSGDTRATIVHGGLPDTAHGAGGDGVLIGIVDTGLALQHQDFRNAWGFTRVSVLWDQTDGAGPAPAGYGYGTEWSGAQIDLGFCREQDSTFFGHGTHVAGIAAGNGRATGNGVAPFTFIGVAPRARLGIVNTTWDDITIVDGVAWLFQKATQLGVPCVVNLSLGSVYGPHDGTSDLDLAMNALSGPGRIIVASAGNANGRGSHGEGTAPATGITSLGVRIFGYTPDPAAPDGLSIDGWYEAGDNLGIAVRTPSGALVGPVTKGGSTMMATSDGWISIDQTGIESTNANGDVEVLIEISDAAGVPPAAGEYLIQLTRIAAPAGGQVDFWIYDTSFSYAPAFTAGRKEQELVISPASADSVVAVAAHTTRASWTSINSGSYNYGQVLNQIGTFSSIGPRRDNVLKPDLSAPGTAIGSAHSAQSQPNPTSAILPDGVHKILQGTSMSCPHVAGTVALMLSTWPNLSAGQARDALRSAARADAFTGAVPNAVWGYGKLDIEQLFRQRLAFSTEVDPPGVMMPGGRAWLHGLCLVPAPGSWRMRGVARVTDSRGWLALINDGPAVPVTAWSDTTLLTAPGYPACVPRAGHLVLDVPLVTPLNDSTVVSLTMEPAGFPFMRQTKTTTLRVSGLSDTPIADEVQDLVARVVHCRTSGIELELVTRAATGPVRLELLDVGGRRIDGGRDVPAQTGPRVLRWTPSSGRLAHGLYFMRITQGAQSRVLRAIVR